MSIIPVSALSLEDLAVLGNNIRRGMKRRRVTPDQRANRRVITAVNRSLASLNERVTCLYPRPVSTCRLS